MISGLSDAGAHAKFICDSALPSWQLAFWTRDRKRGPQIPVETIVRKLSAASAELYGMDDRGTLEVGKRLVAFDAGDALLLGAGDLFGSLGFGCFAHP